MPVVRNNTVYWPNKTVPYGFSKNADLTEEKRGIIEKSVQIVNEVARRAVFVPKKNEPYWAEFKLGSHGQSGIGFLSKSPQYISLHANRSEPDLIKEAVHEMYHCLGFEHEEYADDLEARWLATPSIFGDTTLDRAIRNLEDKRASYKVIVGGDINSTMMYSSKRNQYKTKSVEELTNLLGKNTTDAHVIQTHLSGCESALTHKEGGLSIRDKTAIRLLYL